MCLNLNDYQFKSSRFNYRSTYVNQMVTTNQKPTIGTERKEKKKRNQTTKENHQTATGKTKKNEKRRTTKTTGKQIIKWQ